MKLYALLIPEVDGNFVFLSTISIDRNIIEKELEEILSEDAHGINYLALGECDLGLGKSYGSSDFKILEKYRPRFGYYGEWKKIDN